MFSNIRRIGSRLSFIALIVACLSGFGANPSQANWPSGKYTFAIMSGDMPVGTHVSQFSREGEDTIVETTIEAGMKLLFVKVFEYRHRSREVWREGRLIAFDSETIDDGNRMFVTARATPEGLRVDSSSGSYVAPLGTMVGSLWNPATLNQKQLIHVENGRLEKIRIVPVGTEIVSTPDGRRLEANRYRLAGSVDIDLWYAVPERTLAKLRFTIRGHDIEYRPATLLASAQGR